MARTVVGMICSDFTEMTPNKEHNYCCGAGGGVVNCGPPYKKERMVNNRVKAEQLAATKAEVLIAPCHNCHSGLEDIVHHYGLNMADPRAQEFLNEQMEEFFFGEGARMPDDWVPPGQGGKGAPSPQGKGAPGPQGKGAPAPQAK